MLSATDQPLTLIYITLGDCGRSTDKFLNPKTTT